MKRWNGWGNIHTSYPLPSSALNYLQKRLGIGSQTPDATIDEVLASMPKSRLPDHPLVNINPEVRLRHSRGQSLPDWIALRSGQITSFTDGVAYPSTDKEIRELFNFAREHVIHIIPYGGGTSVVGHINPVSGRNTKLTIDLSRFNKLLSIDTSSHLANIETGITGPALERQLRSEGFTLGHFPQSFEYSTLGGWIATRSSGQQSFYYGRIEDTFAGGHLESPAGPIEIIPVPASAAGPDLRHIVLGSEGRYGVITRATMRIRPLPDVEGFFGAFFRDWNNGLSAVKKIAQTNIPVSMLRLSDTAETEITLALSGKDKLVSWAGRGLRLLGFSANRCLLIYGVTGDHKSAFFTIDQVSKIIRSNEGLLAGSIIGEQWQKSRFLSPYLRNTLWDTGYAVDTLETAVPWNKVSHLASALKVSVMEQAEKNGIKTLVFAHLSHVYRDGASIYITFILPRTQLEDDLLQIWKSIKNAASQTIISYGGTISHQHGIGQDHLPFLEAEKGKIGMDLLQSIQDVCDPNATLNPHVSFLNGHRERID